MLSKPAMIILLVEDDAIVALDLQETLVGAGHEVLGPAETVSQGIAIARKYGALSAPTGRLSITWKLLLKPQRELHLEWRESGVPNLAAPTSRGFGTIMIERSLAANGGEAALRYVDDGLICEMRLPVPEPKRSLRAEPTAGSSFGAAAGGPLGNLRGKRILVVEDEPLIAMEIEACLEAAGCRVIGPAGNLETARHLLSTAQLDAALIDVNLGGKPVDQLAEELAAAGIPFAFATGYGPESLPSGYIGTPVVSKPFSQAELISILASLLLEADQSARVVPLRPTLRH